MNKLHAIFIGFCHALALPVAAQLKMPDDEGSYFYAAGRFRQKLGSASRQSKKQSEILYSFGFRTRPNAMPTASRKCLIQRTTSSAKALEQQSESDRYQR